MHPSSILESLCSVAIGSWGTCDYCHASKRDGWCCNFIQSLSQCSGAGHVQQTTVRSCSMATSYLCKKDEWRIETVFVVFANNASTLSHNPGEPCDEYMFRQHSSIPQYIYYTVHRPSIMKKNKKGSKGTSGTTYTSPPKKCNAPSDADEDADNKSNIIIVETPSPLQRSSHHRRSVQRHAALSRPHRPVDGSSRAPVIYQAL